MVITTPDLAPGFQLAGVETLAVDSAAEAETILRRLLAGGEASLIVVRQALLQALDIRLQRQAESSYQPIVMALPDAAPTLTTGTHRRHLSELIRRIIGFQITFNEEPSRANAHHQ
jgi:vacuolar-type H+-ATPase subunit F/Vma7